MKKNTARQGYLRAVVSVLVMLSSKDRQPPAAEWKSGLSAVFLVLT
jgi:hypothetical protein